MKSLFNTSWKSSIQPRRQVKYRARAPLHIRRKFMSAPLEDDLRKKYSIRSMEVRKGDEVRIVRGSFSKKKGKVTVVDVTRSRIQVGGVQRTKKGGEKLETWFDVSNVLITELDEDDSRRFKQIKLTPQKDKESSSLKSSLKSNPSSLKKSSNIKEASS